MSDEAKKAKAAYQREYRKKHKEQVNASMRKWRAKNKDKVNKYNAEYWEKKASTKNTKQIDSKVDLKSFIDEICILQVDASITNKELTSAYNEWSNNDISTTKFLLEFRKVGQQLGLSQKRDKHGTIWEGVTIKV